MKRMMLVLILLAVCGVVNAGWHPWESNSNNPNHDFSWSNPLNFAGGVVPGPEDDTATHTYNPDFQYPVIIDAQTDAVCRWFGLGSDATNPGQTTVIVNVQGGTLTANQIVMASGNKYVSTCNITDGGYVYSNVDMHIAHADGGDLVGIINIVDGELKCNAGLQVGAWENANEGTYAKIIIYADGTLTAGPWLNIWNPRPNSPENFIDIRGGRMTMPGDLGDYQGYVAAGKIRGYGGKTGVSITTEDIGGVLSTVFEADDFYFDPVPADGAVVYPAEFLTLSWNLPDPNQADPNNNESELIDVYWDTDENGNNAAQVFNLDAGAKSVDVTDLVGNTTYYWKIVVVDPNTGGMPSIVEQAVFSLKTESGNLPPIVNAGGDVLAYLTDGSVEVTMAGMVTDEGSTLNNWTFTKNPPEISDPTIVSVDALNATVTLIQAGTYTLTLTADDGEAAPVSDSMKITVAQNACQAAKLHPDGYVPYQGDVDGDCKVTLTDLALVAADWLLDNSQDGTEVLQ